MMGFLNIDKPAGLGSRDVTSRLAYRLRPHKVGHVGTLDPLATGVLVLCVGKATRLSDLLHSLPKVYEARFAWNRRSDTEDSEGHVEAVNHPPVDADAVREILPRFTGQIEQTPPAFSAKRIRGKRAYDLARAGRAVDLPPKTVTVQSLELLDCDESHFALRIECGSGTYVRSLGRDIAAACGGSVVMDRLRRTRVGPFDVADAISMEEVDASPEEHLVDAAAAVSHLSSVDVLEEEVRPVLDGRKIMRDGAPPGTVAMLDGGSLLALGECDGRTIKPRTVLRDRG